MFLLILCVFAVNVRISVSYSKIAVYGDVYMNKDFFTKTYPWIVDNIGAQIQVQYYMQGSGRYTVPQMCALDQLRDNTFLQAQYLKCEAQERPSEVCLCESGIDPTKFKECVRTDSSMAADSDYAFQQLGIDITPIIELGPQSTVFGVEDTWYLKKICTIFGDNMPRGCTKPFACNGTQALKKGKALAQFDKCCSKMACGSDDVDDDHIATTTLYSDAIYWGDGGFDLQP